MKSKKTKAMLAFLTAILITVFCAALPAYGAAAENDSVMLIPGGMAFGVKFFTQGALVIEVAGIETSNGLVFPAKEAGNFIPSPGLFGSGTGAAHPAGGDGPRGNHPG